MVCSYERHPRGANLFSSVQGRLSSTFLWTLRQHQQLVPSSRGESGIAFFAAYFLLDTCSVFKMLSALCYLLHRSARALQTGLCLTVAFQAMRSGGISEVSQGNAEPGLLRVSCLLPLWHILLALSLHFPPSSFLVLLFVQLLMIPVLLLHETSAIKVVRIRVSELFYYQSNITCHTVQSSTLCHPAHAF